MGDYAFLHQNPCSEPFQGAAVEHDVPPSAAQNAIQLSKNQTFRYNRAGTRVGLNPHSPDEAAQFNSIVTGMKTSFTPFTIFIVRQETQALATPKAGRKEGRNGVISKGTQGDNNFYSHCIRSKFDILLLTDLSRDTGSEG